jgi:hypothetical protein
MPSRVAADIRLLPGSTVGYQSPGDDRNNYDRNNDADDEPPVDW